MMNQMNTPRSESISNSKNVTKFEDNIHDIILFILFGLFVILICESLFKATSIFIKRTQLKDLLNN